VTEPTQPSSHPPSAPLQGRDELVAVFERARRPDPATHLVGTELEKFGVTIPEDPNAPPTTVEYDAHIRPVLEAMCDRFGWEPGPDHGTEGQMVELRRDGASITLEPGGQFELSGKPLPDVHHTCAEFSEHYRELDEVSLPLRLSWMTAGHHPWATRQEVHRMPKGRYAVMGAYLPTKGFRALDMMLRTSTVQANFDYTDEAQCRRRLRLAALMSPVIVSLFANSPYLEGEAVGQASVRGGVWLNVDPDRCGIPNFMVDGTFSFETYVDWLLDVPMFFVKRNDTYHPHHVPFRRYMDEGFVTPDGTRHRATTDDWQLHMSTVFPEVRLKPYIEVRAADAVTSRYVCALPAIVKGLLYDDDATGEALEKLGSPDPGALLSRRREAFERGLASDRCRELARALLDLSRASLDRMNVLDDKGRTEARFLDPLEELVDSGRSPGDMVIADIGDKPGVDNEGRRAFARAFHFAGVIP
jgi:glutamate--cysteine ligase